MSNSAENAIHKDASEQLENQLSGAESDNEVAEQVINPRMAAMEAIASQRRDALAADGVDISGMGEETIENANANDSGENRMKANDDDDQLAQQLGQDDRVSHASHNMRVKVKVDGEELDLPLSEVVKSFQKDAAATRRLQEATKLLQLAEQKANNVAQNNQQENNSSGNDDQPAQASSDERRSQIKDAFSKLYEGDEDGAVEAMLRFVEQGAPRATQQAIDPVAIAAQVKQQLEVESAYGQVRSDYPEVFANDERGVVLGKAAYERMVAKESSGIPRSQALRESTEEVAQLFGIQKSGRQQAEPSRTARDTKLERKANLDIPESANVVAGSKQSPAEAPNVSSVIQEMARQRLGQSMNVR